MTEQATFTRTYEYISYYFVNRKLENNLTTGRTRSINLLNLTQAPRRTRRRFNTGRRLSSFSVTKKTLLKIYFSSSLLPSLATQRAFIIIFVNKIASLVSRMDIICFKYTILNMFIPFELLKNFGIMFSVIR